MRPYNGAILEAENGEPILIIETCRQSLRWLKTAMKSEARYYNNREGYGKVKLRYYTVKAENEL